MDFFESSLVFGRLCYFSRKFYSKHTDGEAMFIDFPKASDQHLCPVRVSLGFMGSSRTYQCLWVEDPGVLCGFPGSCGTVGLTRTCEFCVVILRPNGGP